MRVSIWRLASPRQYAPASESSLNALMRPGVGRVRAAAEVGERAVRVERDGVDALVADEVLDQLDLVRLVLRAEAVERLLDGHVLARERLARLDVLAHLLLERGQVVLGDRDALGELEVVVEAVLDRRADRDLRARVEVEHRRGEHVRGVVADQLERLGRAVGDDLDLGRRRASGRARSRRWPPTLTASAARARPGPIAAARSAPVAPSSRSFRVPSGSWTCIGGEDASAPAAPAGRASDAPRAAGPSRPRRRSRARVSVRGMNGLALMRAIDWRTSASRSANGLGRPLRLDAGLGLDRALEARRR